jgi:anti-sigma factor RsiW
MNCDALRVHAYFDGELSPDEVVLLQLHLGGCVRCQTLLDDLEVMRAALRPAPQTPAPAQLRTRISDLLDAEPRPAVALARPRAWRLHTFWAGLFAGVGASAVAVVLALFAFMPASSAPVIDDLVAAHLHSLAGDHLISMVSSEHHTVKPWFAGRADVAPTVADFAAQGYMLAGGRVDHLAGLRAAVLVYRHGAHVVNVFSWPVGRLPLPRATTQRGYRLLYWQVEDVAYCAVSDTDWSELTALENLLQTQAAAERRAVPQ